MTCLSYCTWCKRKSHSVPCRDMSSTRRRGRGPTRTRWRGASLLAAPGCPGAGGPRPHHQRHAFGSRNHHRNPTSHVRKAGTTVGRYRTARQTDSSLLLLVVVIFGVSFVLSAVSLHGNAWWLHLPVLNPRRVREHARHKRRRARWTSTHGAQAFSRLHMHVPLTARASVTQLDGRRLQRRAALPAGAGVRAVPCQPALCEL